MSLCKYSNIFGAPNTGVHSYKIFNIAIVDLGLTILLAFGISSYCDINFILTLIVILIIGIIMHKIFCVETALNKLIFKKN